MDPKKTSKEGIFLRKTTLGAAHEEAAEMGLGPSFFAISGINPKEVCYIDEDGNRWEITNRWTSRAKEG